MPSFGEKAPKGILRSLGILNVLLALFGLSYNAVYLLADYSSVVDARQPYFYEAFYTMSGICIVSYLILLYTGVQFIRLDLSAVPLFCAVLAFEIVYVIAISALWRMGEEVALSVAGASGVSSGGQVPQLFSLYPVWGIVLALWSRKKLRTANGLKSFQSIERVD